MTAGIKETKAQRVERIKKEKDGLDVLVDIHRYAQSGEAVDPEDIDRFKWYGLYTQNRTLQDEGDPTQYFMLRVKLEEGRMGREQIETLGLIARDYGNGAADFTTRQDLQFHWIRVADLPTIFALLEEAGLSTQLAAGDCPRNVVSCPVSGIDHDEIADVRHLVTAVNDLFRSNHDFSNLPRKYKIGISGCHKHCISPEIQDLAFAALRDESGKILYGVHVGGGLGKNRRIATPIGCVEESGVVPVAKAVAKIFRDHGNRENRDRARLGHLIELWGVQKFVALLHEELGFALLPPVEQAFTPYSRRSHFGVSPGKEAGKSYVGCAVTGGRIGAEGLLALARIMKSHGAENAKTTTTQNIVILDAPSHGANTLAEELEGAGISADPSPFKARTLACTGLNFCKFAISETKEMAHTLVAHLQRHFPDFSEPLSISVNGCPNSCAHPHVVDIGLMGTMLRRGEEKVAGFELIYGGTLAGPQSRFGTRSGIRVTPEEAPAALEGLIREYQESDGDSFRSFILEKVCENESLSTVD